MTDAPLVMAYAHLIIGLAVLVNVVLNYLTHRRVKKIEQQTNGPLQEAIKLLMKLP